MSAEPFNEVFFTNKLRFEGIIGEKIQRYINLEEFFKKLGDLNDFLRSPKKVFQFDDKDSIEVDFP